MFLELAARLALDRGAAKVSLRDKIRSEDCLPGRIAMLAAVIGPSEVLPGSLGYTKDQIGPIGILSAIRSMLDRYGVARSGGAASQSRGNWTFSMTSRHSAERAGFCS